MEIQDTRIKWPENKRFSLKVILFMGIILIWLGSILPLSISIPPIFGILWSSVCIVAFIFVISSLIDINNKELILSLKWAFFYCIITTLPLIINYLRNNL